MTVEELLNIVRNDNIKIKIVSSLDNRTMARSRKKVERLYLYEVHDITPKIKVKNANNGRSQMATPYLEISVNERTYRG